jgi:hypothetical protein
MRTPFGVQLKQSYSEQSQFFRRPGQKSVLPLRLVLRKFWKKISWDTELVILFLHVVFSQIPESFSSDSADGER